MFFRNYLKKNEDFTVYKNFEFFSNSVLSARDAEIMERMLNAPKVEDNAKELIQRVEDLLGGILTQKNGLAAFRNKDIEKIRQIKEE